MSSVVPASLGLSFYKNFHTCPACGHACKDKHKPEAFEVDFNTETFHIKLFCTICGHHWEI